MLSRFHKKSGELTDLTNKVTQLTLDINKQQMILDKLNQINNEKARKITEIERYITNKRGKPEPKEYKYYDHEKSFNI
jgi:hypothetical protein